MKFFFGALAVAFAAYVIVSEDGTLSSSRSAAISTCPASVTATSPAEQVAALQRALRERGHTINVDGVYGDDTRQALMTFQQQNGIATDGVAGSATWSELGRC